MPLPDDSEFDATLDEIAYKTFERSILDMKLKQRRLQMKDEHAMMTAVTDMSDDDAIQQSKYIILAYASAIADRRCRAALSFVQPSWTWMMHQFDLVKATKFLFKATDVDPLHIMRGVFAAHAFKLEKPISRNADGKIKMVTLRVRIDPEAGGLRKEVIAHNVFNCVYETSPFYDDAITRGFFFVNPRPKMYIGDSDTGLQRLADIQARREKMKQA